MITTKEGLHEQVRRVQDAHHEGLSVSFWHLVCPPEELPIYGQVNVSKKGNINNLQMWQV